MYFLRSIISIFFLMTIFCGKSYSESIDHEDSYIASFKKQSREEILAESKKITQKRKNEKYTFDAKFIDTKTKHVLVLNNMINDNNIYKQKSIDVYNKYLASDLKLFLGTNTNPQYTLLNRINRTSTVIGEVNLFKILSNPTDDIKELKKRQDVTKILIDEENIFNKIDKLLDAYKNIENSIISFWSDKDPLSDLNTTKEYMRDLFLFSDEDKNTPTKIELYKIFRRDILGIWFPLCWVPVVFTMMTPITTNPIVLLAQYNGFLNDEFIKYGPWYFSLVNIYCAYNSHSNYKHNSKLLRSLAQRLYDINILIKILIKLSQCVNDNKKLNSLIGEKFVFIKNLMSEMQKDKDLQFLISLLDNGDLSNFSYFRSNSGKLLYVYNKISTIRNKLVNCTQEIGNIDVYMSFAKLYKESKQYDSSVNYNFVEYLDKNSKSGPYVKIDKMWNCMLDAKNAITNNIELGNSTQRNMLLTGPNAGGKSTFISGVTICLVLSQTLGFVPAEYMQLTPFRKINTYINISDDVSAGESLFVAEVKRMKYHMNIINELSDDDYVFTVQDEPFSGTNFREGSAAEFALIEHLAKNKNSLSIIATHFPIVMGIEDKVKNNSFKNYKVFINRDEDNKIIYTYKIVEGKSNQAIALDILQQKGYDAKFLERAKDIMNHPENYKASFN